MNLHRLYSIGLCAAVCLSLSGCANKTEKPNDVRDIVTPSVSEENSKITQSAPNDAVNSAGNISAGTAQNSSVSEINSESGQVPSSSSASSAVSSTSSNSAESSEHEHSYTANTVEPTCETQGYTVYTCSCGNRYTDNFTDALGHSYTQSVVNPTCTNGGYTLNECTRCGTKTMDNYTEALGHSYSKGETVAPTCTASGYTTYVCKNCGFSYNDDYTGATGHAWGNWSVVTEATATSTGKRQCECTRCGEIRTETIARLSDSGNFADEVVTLVNAERTKQGIAPLTARNDLNEYAQLRSTEIVSNFAHERPDGASPLDYVMSLSGVMRSGENIAWGQSTPEEVMNAWMNSDGHRKNILNPDFTLIGVGCFESNGRKYWTQIFAGN